MHAVMILFSFKGQVKSLILHNTRDESEFYVPLFSQMYNIGGGLRHWVGWEEEEEEFQGSILAYYEACLSLLKNIPSL